MNRRNFLTKLGIGAAACAVVPKIAEENVDYDEVYDLSDEPRDGRRVEESIGLEGRMQYEDMGFIFPGNMQHREVTVDGVTWKIPERMWLDPRV